MRKRLSFPLKTCYTEHTTHKGDHTMRKLECRREALFQYRGLPPVGMAVSMALQHLVAMIVGCVTPAIIIANVAGLAHDQRVLLIQASLVMSAVTTLL